MRYLFSLQKINRITAGGLTENIAMKKIMHKSNMVPVSKNVDAKEYATMRRN